MSPGQFVFVVRRSLGGGDTDFGAISFVLPVLDAGCMVLVSVPVPRFPSIPLCSAASIPLVRSPRRDLALTPSTPLHPCDAASFRVCSRSRSTSPHNRIHAERITAVERFHSTFSFYHDWALHDLLRKNVMVMEWLEANEIREQDRIAYTMAKRP